MVSNIKYRSMKHVKLRGKSPFKILATAALVLIGIAAEPQIALFSIGVTYVSFGLLEAIPGFGKWFAEYRAKHRRAPSPPDADAEDDGEDDMDAVIEEVMEN